MTYAARVVAPRGFEENSKGSKGGDKGTCKSDSKGYGKGSCKGDSKGEAKGFKGSKGEVAKSDGEHIAWWTAGERLVKIAPGLEKHWNALIVARREQRFGKVSNKDQSAWVSCLLRHLYSFTGFFNLAKKDDSKDIRSSKGYRKMCLEKFEELLEELSDPKKWNIWIGTSLNYEPNGANLEWYDNEHQLIWDALVAMVPIMKADLGPDEKKKEEN